MKINNIPLTQEVLKQNPSLPKVTENAVKELVKAIEKFYKKHKIIVEVNYEVVSQNEEKKE